jgi:uncharacterized protein YkwD
MIDGAWGGPPVTPAAFTLVLVAAVLTPDERAVLDLTNKERTAAGLEKLTPHPILTRMARSHSATMARLNQLGHDLGGKTFQDRAAASGYRFGRAGENVGQGYATPKAAVEGWMNSEPHKANILNAEFIQVGVAVARAEDGTRYWTQVFAAPPK